MGKDWEVCCKCNEPEPRECGAHPYGCSRCGGEYWQCLRCIGGDENDPLCLGYDPEVFDLDTYVEDDEYKFLDKTLLCGYCQEHKERAEIAEIAVKVYKERAEIAEKEKMEELNQIIAIIDKCQMSKKNKSLIINFLKNI